MKISARLYLLMVLAIVGFLAIFFVSFSTSSQITALNELQKSCLDLKSDLFKLDSVSKDLLISSNMAANVKTWNDLFASCDPEMKNFVGSKVLASLAKRKTRRLPLSR